MKRSKHSLSHYVLSTFDMGQLIPVGHFEVLPGDSVRMATSALLRVSPLMAPVMHPVQVRLHHWFVPYRILDETWEEFITGGSDGEGDGATIPTIDANAGSTGLKTLGDYFGTPELTVPGTALTAFPFYAYNKIFNEFYRDQDLQTEVAENNAAPLNVAWEKDYFTSARPWTQKGPDVTIPLGSTAPVVSTGATPTLAGVTSNQTGELGIRGASPPHLGIVNPSGAFTDGEEVNFHAITGLETDLSGATSVSVNDLRLALALQRYQEARAQYGSRYTEYLRYLGVRSSDARLQRPEYLGGGRTTIAFSEVLKTGEGDTPSDDAPIGEMRGHGISAVRSRRWIRFFEEHGIVMTLCSIRPRSMYMDGLHRMWRKRTREDWWQRELEQIGQQEIYQQEVYANSATPSEVFGWQDRYSEYRHMPSYVTSEFRTTMNDWHLARAFGSEPALNEDFIQCVPSKRIHAEQTTNVIWGMFSHSIQARRLVGKRTIGRVF